jgi:hypothetical protein
MLVHVLLVMHLAAAFSSNQERLNGGPLSASASKIRGDLQSKLKSSLSFVTAAFSKPKSTPTIGLLDSGVTGYYIDASYASDDFTCKELESGAAYLLNSCVVYEDDYVIFTATANMVAMTTYRDAKCQEISYEGTPFAMVTDCNFFDRNYYVSASTDIPSSKLTVQYK